MPTLAATITLLETYKYLVLFPIAIIEGPIVTIIVGLLVTMGIFNPFFAYGIIIVGDICGDTLYYLIGRYSNKFSEKITSKFKIAEIDKIKKYFLENQNKSILLSKIVHGFGVTGLIVAGHIGIPYPKYMRTAVAVSLVQSLVFLLLGIFFGHAYLQFEKYFHSIAAISITTGIAVITILIIRSLFSRKSSL